MSDFYNPIHRPKPTDEARIPVPPVEPNKQDKEEQSFEDLNDPDRQKYLYGSIVLFFKRIFNTALFSRKNRGSLPDSEIAFALNTFYNLLLELKTSDKTDDPHFAQKLSDAWDVLLASPINSPLEPFIQLANDYPVGDAHSFGFYLSEHTGDDWLPVPFLEILKKLHQGFVLRKKNSELAHMLDLLKQASKSFSI